MSKKILYILSIISITLLIFFIVTTYAKYSSQSDQLSCFNLTSWKLLINNSDITSNSNFSSTITPTFTNTTYISDGVIAPTSTGYFDIEIDSTNTNLSFNYLITLSTANSSIVDYNITGYSINDFTTILPYDSSISGDVLYDSENKINLTVIRIYVHWNDSLTNTTNNEEDTTLAINNSTSSLDIEMSLTQKTDTYNF